MKPIIETDENGRIIYYKDGHRDEYWQRYDEFGNLVYHRTYCSHWASLWENSRRTRFLLGPPYGRAPAVAGERAFVMRFSLLRTTKHASAVAPENYRELLPSVHRLRKYCPQSIERGRSTSSCAHLTRCLKSLGVWGDFQISHK